MARVLIAAVTTVALLATTTGAAGGRALVGPAEAQLVSSTGPARGVAENFRGVYTTADDGAHWVNVTPPSLRANPILLDHVDGIASFGADRVWLVVSANAGYGTRLVYTWDGGKSWRVTPIVPGPSGAPLSFLPGDANPATTPAFLSADDGWVMAGLGPRDRGGLFRTRDGGAHWSFVGDASFQGSIVFINQTDGWGISAPTWTNAGTVKTPGGVLYQSTDDGEAKQGERLPPARDLAAVLGVNTNTVLRALRELRDEGLLEFRRGRSITVAGTPRQGAVIKQARDLVGLARHHGYDLDELVRIIQAVG